MTKLIACAFFLGISALAQQTHETMTRVWAAQWIDMPGASSQDYGVYHFRRTFDLASKPQQFVIYVSGDNRYQLYVNGKRVSWGPARGDLTHWRYETVDIAPELQAGKNVLAAVVWNDGPYRAIAQITNQTGFVLNTQRAEDAAVNTNRSWKCVQDRAYSPQPLSPDQDAGYFALAAHEKFDALQYPWGWEQLDFDDSAWQPAHELTHAAPRDARDAPNRWMLVPRMIPLEEQTPQRILKMRKADGVAASDEFLKGHSPLRVPPHARASLLLDQTYLTTAYPELTVSGGKGSSISLRYAESPFIGRRPIRKGNRNDIEGTQFYGPSDTYLADGGSHRLYRPLYWRTYRYIQVNIET
ncbi:MAG: alpha-L-rhamnosidase N-terminal domain-containing protein, partial [Bryobacteraceae bacterium]